MPELDKRRKADREKMAEAVRALAEEFGIPAQALPGYGPRKVKVEIEAPRGVRFLLSFDGDSRQRAIVVSWYMESKATAKFAPFFARSVNPFHWQKATDAEEGFDSLLAVLRERFEALADGSAFQAEPAP